MVGSLGGARKGTREQRSNRAGRAMSGYLNCAIAPLFSCLGGGGRRGGAGAPCGIRTRDLHLERVASWAARLWGHPLPAPARGARASRNEFYGMRRLVTNGGPAGAAGQWVRRTLMKTALRVPSSSRLAQMKARPPTARPPPILAPAGGLAGAGAP